MSAWIPSWHAKNVCWHLNLLCSDTPSKFSLTPFRSSQVPWSFNCSSIFAESLLSSPVSRFSPQSLVILTAWNCQTSPKAPTSQLSIDFQTYHLPSTNLNLLLTLHGSTLLLLWVIGVFLHQEWWSITKTFLASLVTPLQPINTPTKKSIPLPTTCAVWRPEYCVNLRNHINSSQIQ